MAFHAFVSGERPTITQWNDWVARRTVADCTSSTRPSSPVEGEPIFETDNDRWVVYNGSAWCPVGQLGAWSAYTPTWAASGSAPAIGNGTIAGRWQRLFDRWHAISIKMTFGSTTTFGTGNYTLSLPSGMGNAVATSIGRIAISASTNYFGTANVYNASAVIVLGSVTSGSNPSMTNVTPTVPVSLASTNSIAVSIVLEGTTGGV